MPPKIRHSRWIPLAIKHRIRQLIHVLRSRQDVIARILQEENMKISLSTVDRIVNKEVLERCRQSVEPHAARSNANYARDVGSATHNKTLRKPSSCAKPPGYDFFCYLIDTNNWNQSAKSRLRNRWQLWQTLSDGEKAMYEEKGQVHQAIRCDAMEQFGLRGAYKTLTQSDKIRVGAIVNPEINMPGLLKQLRGCRKKRPSTSSESGNARRKRQDEYNQADAAANEAEDDDTASNWRTHEQQDEIHDHPSADGAAENPRQQRKDRREELSMDNDSDNTRDAGPSHRSSTGRSDTPPQENPVNSQAAIARVVGHGIVDGQYRFLVTWTGKAEAQTSWLELDKFNNSIIALKDYLERARLNVEIAAKNGQLSLKVGKSWGQTVASAVMDQYSYGRRRHWEKESAVESNQHEGFQTEGQLSAESTDFSLVGGTSNPTAVVRHKSSGLNRLKERVQTERISTGLSPVVSKRRKLSPDPEDLFPASRAESTVSRDGQIIQTAEATSASLRGLVRVKIESEPNTAEGATLPACSASGNEFVQHTALKVTESKAISSGTNIAIADRAVTVTEGFVFEDPAALGQKPGFQLGWTPDRIVAVVPDSYPKRYVVKWEGSRVVEQVEKAVLLEHVPRMLINFLESHV